MQMMSRQGSNGLATANGGNVERSGAEINDSSCSFPCYLLKAVVWYSNLQLQGKLQSYNRTTIILCTCEDNSWVKGRDDCDEIFYSSTLA